MTTMEVEESYAGNKRRQGSAFVGRLSSQQVVPIPIAAAGHCSLLTKAITRRHRQRQDKIESSEAYATTTVSLANQAQLCPPQ